MSISALMERRWLAPGSLVTLWLLSVVMVYLIGDIGVPRMQPITLLVSTIVVCAHAGVFIFRKVHPQLVFLAGVVAAVVLRILPEMHVPASTSINYGLMSFSAFALVLYGAPRSRVWLVLFSSAVVLSVTDGVIALHSAADILAGLAWSREAYTVVSVLSAWPELLVGAVAAVIVRNSRQLSAEHRRADVAAERTRIARELHDTTAHHLTGIAISATAARAVFDRDPEQARASLERISASASEALAEIRLTLGQLRGGEPAPLLPQPQLGDIPVLIDQCRELGMSLSIIGEGLDPQLARAEQICAHQILREALTNARKHAPGAQVRVELGKAGLVVHTDGYFAVAVDGRGTLGMKERATAVGAILEQGPEDDGWVVRLRWRTQ